MGKMPAVKKKKARKPGAGKPVSRARQLAALKAESERHLEELIARRLAMPVEQRLNFLRVRLGFPHFGTAL